ncbi:GNAT family N-acetyltransferase (plasmid) [Pseudomonas corrugata]|uniref:GNAT family N-acetyltransferase n=1 Tax=Pseudomonas corrugata TaxID=47879 RepID=UPI003D81C2A0
MDLLHISDLRTLQQSHRNDILRLAKRNGAELINRPVKPNHAMFGITVAWMLADIDNQLAPYMSKKINSEVIIITTPESKAIGFLTFTRSINSPTACGLNYVCVDSKYRNQGLMRLMIDHLKSIYTDVALACFPGLVEMYEKLGFVMCEADGAQVAMRIGGENVMNTISQQMLMEHDNVRHATQLMIDKYGPKKAVKINDTFDEETKQISMSVKIFVRDRYQTQKL